MALNSSRPLTGKHCLITGGSTGLGLQVCKQLAAQGANLSILARRKEIIEEAIALVRESTEPSDQRILGFPVDCTDCAALRKTVETAIARHDNSPPHLVICCVGSAKPLAFMALDDNDFDNQMKVNYYSAVYTARAVMPFMLAANLPSKIVFVSSVAGLLGFGGYSAYAPAKAALKAFADCIRHELVPTQISVHVFLPASFDSPGFANEQFLKLELTKKVEACDPILTPMECASILLNGLHKNHYIITTSKPGQLVRCAGLVHAPTNNILIDFFLCIIGFIALHFWRQFELDPLSRKYPAVKAGIATDDSIKSKSD